MSRFRHRVLGGTAVLGGLLWAVSPHLVGLLQRRTMNLLYLVAVGLLFVGMHGIEDPVGELGAVGAFGYAVTFLAILLVAVGAVLQVAYAPENSVHYGVDIDRVFFGGFYLLVVGAPFLGFGLRAGDVRTVVAPVVLLLALPVAAIGLLSTNVMGVTQFSWIPVTVPYGLGWVALGVSLGRTGRADGTRGGAAGVDPSEQ